MKSVVIALVGEIGAGKETCKDILWDVLHERGFYQSKAVIRFSDILFATLQNWDIVTSRPNLQKLAQVMNKAYGKGTLTRAVLKRIEDDLNEIKVIDGVRWLTDAKMVRSLPRSILVYITADQNTRYERAKTRNAKAGEGQMTLEEFQNLNQAKNEVDIPKIGATADFKIVNNGTLQEYRAQVVTCFENLILPILRGEEQRQLL